MRDVVDDLRGRPQGLFDLPDRSAVAGTPLFGRHRSVFFIQPAIQHRHARSTAYSDLAGRLPDRSRTPVLAQHFGVFWPEAREDRLAARACKQTSSQLAWNVHQALRQEYQPRVVRTDLPDGGDDVVVEEPDRLVAHEPLEDRSVRVGRRDDLDELTDREARQDLDSVRTLLFGKGDPHARRTIDLPHLELRRAFIEYRDQVGTV